MTARIGFVDTETTSLHPTLGEIWEVALVIPNGAAATDTAKDARTEHHWFVRCEHLETADPFSLDIGRFHQRHPQGNQYRPTVETGGGGTDTIWHGETGRAKFAAQFSRLTHGIHIAGAVISFDDRRLTDLMIAEHQPWQPWHYHVIDVEALAAGYLAGRFDAEPARYVMGSAIEQPPWSSEALSKAVGVDPAQFDRHTALGDARWARAIYDAVMATE